MTQWHLTPVCAGMSGLPPRGHENWGQQKTLGKCVQIDTVLALRCTNNQEFHDIWLFHLVWVFQNECHEPVFLDAFSTVAVVAQWHFPLLLPVHSKFLRNWAKQDSARLAWGWASHLLRECDCHIWGLSSFTDQRQGRADHWYSAPWQPGESRDGEMTGYGSLIQSRLKKQCWKMGLYLQTYCRTQGSLHSAAGDTGTPTSKIQVCLLCF